MRVYIMRHGEAARQESEEQSLTARGRRQVADAGMALLEAGAPELIVHSPKLRACQTAAIVAELMPAVPLQESVALVPGASPNAVLPQLTRMEVESVLLVSHLPLVGNLLTWLVSGSNDGSEWHGYPPAGLVALDAEIVGRGCATLSFCAWPPEFEHRT